TANNRAIPNHSAVTKTRTCFQNIGATEVAVFWRGAMNVAPHIGITLRRIEGAVANDGQAECIHQQFSLKLSRETGARIIDDFPRHWIDRISLEFARARRDWSQFLERNLPESPCHRRRINLEKREAQLLSCSHENL